MSPDLWYEVYALVALLSGISVKFCDLYTLPQFSFNRILGLYLGYF